VSIEKTALSLQATYSRLIPPKLHLDNKANMPKRKREDAEDGPTSGIKQRRISHKLKLHITKIGHAFKTSKGLERQKLGRRHKTATSKAETADTSRIDSEILALKALDTSLAARQHLYKSLLKIKDVANHPDLPPGVLEPVKLPAESATLNVHARLCKSNLVQEALNPAVVDVQLALGLKVDKSKVVKKRRVRAADYDGGGQPTSGNVKREPKKERTKSASTNVVNGGDPRFDTDARPSAPYRDDGNSDFDDNEPSGADDLDVEALERRLASEGVKQESKQHKTPKYSLEADMALSNSDHESRSSSPEPSKASAPAPKNSSFIPSLTLAGYVSGSGSDIDDHGPSLGVRKNRRGQRARQQIWEQKFGMKAKHLQKGDRNSGWDAKRGAVESGGGARRGNGDVGGRAALPQGHAERWAGKGDEKKWRESTKAADDGPIHPSWEAAKRAKAKGDAPVAFQGKKVTFS